jgi:hypothetical protein
MKLMNLRLPAVALVALAVLAAGVGAAQERRAPAASTVIRLPVVLSAPVDAGAALVNGSFEAGWTDMPPAPGNLINQQPQGWTLLWLQPGQTLWNSNDEVTGVPECVHKLKWQLPPNEWPGQPDALILDGETTYKIFHSGASFGGQLTQRIQSLPGGRYRLTFPVRTHLHENLPVNWDHYTVESGIWALSGGQQTGGWANAFVMGDRKWFYHVLEFDVESGATLDLLIRVKSKYRGPKDFFMDDITLERLGTGTEAPRPAHSVLWLPRPVESLPQAERVTP